MLIVLSPSPPQKWWSADIVISSDPPNTSSLDQVQSHFVPVKEDQLKKAFNIWWVYKLFQRTHCVHHDKDVVMYYCTAVCTSTLLHSLVLGSHPGSWLHRWRWWQKERAWYAMHAHAGENGRIKPAYHVQLTNKRGYTIERPRNTKLWAWALTHSNITVAVSILLLWWIYWKGGCLDIKKVAITTKHYKFDPSLASWYTYQLCHITKRYALSMLSNTSCLLERHNIFPQDTIF